jgi:hypothetical protein
MALEKKTEQFSVLDALPSEVVSIIFSGFSPKQASLFFNNLNRTSKQGPVKARELVFNNRSTLPAHFVLYLRSLLLRPNPPENLIKQIQQIKLKNCDLSVSVKSDLLISGLEVAKPLTLQQQVLYRAACIFPDLVSDTALILGLKTKFGPAQLIKSQFMKTVYENACVESSDMTPPSYSYPAFSTASTALANALSEAEILEIIDNYILPHLKKYYFMDIYIRKSDIIEQCFQLYVAKLSRKTLFSYLEKYLSIIDKVIKKSNTIENSLYWIDKTARANLSAGEGRDYFKKHIFKRLKKATHDKQSLYRYLYDNGLLNTVASLAYDNTEQFLSEHCNSHPCYYDPVELVLKKHVIPLCLNTTNDLDKFKHLLELLSKRTYSYLIIGDILALLVLCKNILSQIETNDSLLELFEQEFIKNLNNYSKSPHLLPILEELAEILLQKYSTKKALSFEGKLRKTSLAAIGRAFYFKIRVSELDKLDKSDPTEFQLENTLNSIYINCISPLEEPHHRLTRLKILLSKGKQLNNLQIIDFCRETFIRNPFHFLGNDLFLEEQEFKSYKTFLLRPYESYNNIFPEIYNYPPGISSINTFIFYVLVKKIKTAREIPTMQWLTEALANIEKKSRYREHHAYIIKVLFETLSSKEMFDFFATKDHVDSFFSHAMEYKLTALFNCGWTFLIRCKKENLPPSHGENKTLEILLNSFTELTKEKLQESSKLIYQYIALLNQGDKFDFIMELITKLPLCQNNLGVFKIFFDLIQDKDKNPLSDSQLEQINDQLKLIKRCSIRNHEDNSSHFYIDNLFDWLTLTQPLQAESFSIQDPTQAEKIVRGIVSGIYLLHRSVRSTFGSHETKSYAIPRLKLPKHAAQMMEAYCIEIEKLTTNYVALLEKFTDIIRQVELQPDKNPILTEFYSPLKQILLPPVVKVSAPTMPPPM